MASARDYRRILGAAIRRERVKTRLTIELLAEKSELHPNYLGRVERGEEYISIAALLRVAKGLGIRLHQLVREL